MAGTGEASRQGLTPSAPGLGTGDPALFRRLVESAPDAIVVVDSLGRIVLVNAQVEKLFGYLRDELLGEMVEVLVPGPVRKQHQVHRTGYSRTHKARGMGSGLELRGRRKDGSELPIEVSLSPIETEHGTLTSSVIRDITERKRLEAAARLASERLLGAVESIQGTLALYDRQDRLVLCNSAYRELFCRGIDGSIVGRSHAEVVDGSIATGLSDPGAAPTEVFRERWLDYHANPVGTFDVGTREGQTLRVSDRRTLEGGVISTGLDITDDVTHESELKEARALAEAASNAKSEFLSSMSHEIRTPLNSILGFAQLLQREKKPPLTGRQKDRLDHVLKGGGHLLRLIDDILDLSGIEAGRTTVSLEPVGVAEVLADVKATLAPMSSRMGIDIVVEQIPSEAPRVVADRTRLTQILINFGSNAIKYGRRGGRARFSVSAPRNEFVRICVADDGMGIPKDEQDKLFQPFQRAGQETGPIEGTGIGLTIAKRLVELMAGSVGFRSSPEDGSEFWIDLPRHAAERNPVGREESEPRAESSALARTDGIRYTVVYIEDNPSNIAFMQELIAELEHVSLIAVPTAELGIEIVRERRPDLVLMDINLPGMSGYEATRRLHESPQTRDIPVIALTAAATAGDRKRAQDAGLYRYLTKPLKIDEFIQTLEELFTRRIAGLE